MSSSQLLTRDAEDFRKMRNYKQIVLGSTVGGLLGVGALLAFTLHSDGQVRQGVMTAQVGAP